MKRFLAQRPLPSMMMAMWRGTSPTLGIACVELVNFPAMTPSSNQ
jgi:hypothetical protein